MRIGVDMGHTPTSPGASGYLDELYEDRLIGAALITILEARGHTVFDITAPNSYAYPDEVNYRVNYANSLNLDIIVSIHLNAGGGTGTEVLYFPGDDYGYQLAVQISANVAGLFGLPDRGAKARDNVGVIVNTNVTAVLVETVFVDRREDYDAFMKKSYESMATAIADGIEGKEHSEGVDMGWKNDGIDYWWYKREDGSYIKDEWENIDDAWFYFGSDGYVKTKWFKVNDQWFYSEPEHNNHFGEMWHDRWVFHNEKWYYLGHDGHMLTDRIFIDAKGSLYAVDKDGVLMEGDLKFVTGTGGRLKAVR